jgi:hypothetical protein
MGVMNNGMGIMGINIDWQQVIKGLVLLGAVAFDLYNKKRLDAGRSLDGIARCLRAITCTWDRLLLSEDDATKAFCKSPTVEIGDKHLNFVILGRSQERSDATQTQDHASRARPSESVQDGIDISRTIFFAIFVHPLLTRATMPPTVFHEGKANGVQGGERATTGGAVARLPDVRRHGPAHHPHRTGVAGLVTVLCPKRPTRRRVAARPSTILAVARRALPGHACCCAWPSRRAAVRSEHARGLGTDEPAAAPASERSR